MLSILPQMCYFYPSMKRVLYIIEAVEGGAWRHLRDVIRATHGKTLECRVALSFERHLDNVDSVRSFLESINVPLYEIPMKRGAAPGDMAAVLKLTKLIRDLQPDLVHAHCAKAGVLGRVAAKLGKVPAVYTPHCFPFLMKDDGFSRAYSMVERGMVRVTSAIIVLSLEEQGEARNLGYPENRIHLIPNGIKPCGLDLPQINNNGVLKLAFFGRSGAQKGNDEFARLVRDLNMRGIRTEGNIFGRLAPEHLTSNIQHPTPNLEKSKNFIRICGNCPQEQVIEKMRDFDVVVMPSRWEGLPYVLLEALDAGVPVSAYRVGGIGDVVEHGVSAMLAKADDFDGLVENTAQLFDADLRRKIAEEGQKVVAAYTLDRMVEATLAVYANLE